MTTYLFLYEYLHNSPHNILLLEQRATTVARNTRNLIIILHRVLQHLTVTQVVAVAVVPARGFRQLINSRPYLLIMGSA